MKVTIRGDELRSAVLWVARLCPSRPVVPALGGILADAVESLRLTGFDLETAGTVELPDAGLLEPGRCLVSGNLLAAVCKTLRPSDEVDLVADDRVMRVGAGSSTWTLPLMAVDEYPRPPASGERVGEVDATDGGAALTRVTPARGAHGCGVAELDGTVRLASDGEVLVLAATDRYRIAFAELRWHPAAGGEPLDLVAPADLLAAVVGSASGPVVLRTDGGTLTAEANNRVVTGGLVDPGRFPRMSILRDHLAVDVATRVMVDVADVVHTLERAVAVLGQVRQVRVGLTPEGGTVSAQCDEADAHHPFAVGLFIGQPIEVAVNAGWLLDGLKACGDTAVLSLPEAQTKPFLIQPVGSDGAPTPGYRYLCITIQGGP